MKKILFVGMAQSVHLQRWISQLDNESLEIHLFPSMDIGFVHPDFRHVTVHHTFYVPQPDLHPSVKEQGIRIGIPFVRNRFSKFFTKIARRLTHFRLSTRPDYRVVALERVIQQIQPDIVHAVEFQYGAYLALQAKERMGDRFPIWIVTNYGSDVYLFGRLAEHRDRVKAILEQCDYYTCECERDVALAQSMGLKGKPLPVLPNAGGFDLEHIAALPRIDPTSARRQIILKGYQHFAGRALVGLQAIRQCADVLQDYRIVIYSAFPEVKIAAELCALDTGLEIEILPSLSHDEMLEQFGKSRLYIGLSISDGISTSLLEAMVMGTFPIQSSTACADEWVEDGVSGLLVPPEDVTLIAEALRRALDDDTLVDHAAAINTQTCHERLGMQTTKAIIRDMYQQVFEENEHA